MPSGTRIGAGVAGSGAERYSTNAGSRTRFAIGWPRSERGSSPRWAAAVSLHHSMRFSASRITTPSGRACAARRDQRIGKRLGAPRGIALVAVDGTQQLVPGAEPFGQILRQRLREPADDERE